MRLEIFPKRCKPLGKNLRRWVIKRPTVFICAEGASFSATPDFQELVYVCPFVTDLSDFYEAGMRRPRSLFLLVAFQLGFSGIPEIHEKTSISPS